ncbi:MAG: pentapeptide repeat-containing protein [Microcoleaceae cyanobacterium]
MDAQEFISRYTAGEKYFRGISLYRADLSRIPLDAVDFSGASFEFVLFGDAYAKYVNSYVNFSGAKLRNCTLRGQFNFCDFTEAQIKYGNLECAKFFDCDWRGVQAKYCLLTWTCFVRANFEGASLGGSGAAPSELWDTIGYKGELIPGFSYLLDPPPVMLTQNSTEEYQQRIEAGRAFLARMDVKEFLARYKAGERDFRGVSLYRANLRRFPLDGVDFSGAVFQYVKFCGAYTDCVNSHIDFSGAKFWGCDITGKFSFCDFRSAEMVHCDLEWTRFYDCDFRRANSRLCNIDGTEFVRVNFEGAKLSGSGQDPCELCDVIDYKGELISGWTRYLNSLYKSITSQGR